MNRLPVPEPELARTRCCVVVEQPARLQDEVVEMARLRPLDGQAR